MEHDEIIKFVDALPPVKPTETIEMVEQTEHKGIGIKKKTFTFLMVSLVSILVITAGAGLINIFATINSTINVTETSIKINGYSAPYTISETLNGTAGQNYTTVVNVSTVIDNVVFAVNYTTDLPEGITVNILDENNTIIPTHFHVGGTWGQYRNIKIVWCLSPLIESGAYNCKVTFNPMGYEYI